jgi:hypothetical protein
MPHAWKVGTPVSLHLHWAKTTSAAGTVKWQSKYEWTNIGDTRAGFSSYVDGTEGIPNSNIAGKHALFEFTDLPGTGKGISSMINVVIQRVSSGGTPDTYGAAVKLFEVDIHYLVDGFGSQ